MWIVYLSDNTRHSAWNTKTEALNQQRVLREAGYKGTYSAFDSTTWCENGYYYV